MCTCTHIRTVTRAQCTIYVYTYIRPRFHKLDYAYEASARDERASGSPKGDRAFKNDSPRSLPPPLPFPLSSASFSSHDLVSFAETGYGD